MVVKGRGAGLSLAALVKGFLEFRKDSSIAGVIVNCTSPMMAERLRGPIEETGAAFLGCLPKLPDIRLESRHLGLVMPGEVKELEESLTRLAEEMERHLDLDRLLELAAGCRDLSACCVHTGGNCVPAGGKGPAFSGETVPVAVARDEAFCFYYEENLRLLEELGAEEFIFTDRGCIVNLIHILQVKDGTVVLKDGTVLPVSRSHVQEVKEEINRYWGEHI